MERDMMIEYLESEVAFWKEQFETLVDILCSKPCYKAEDLEKVIDNIVHKKNLE